MQAEIRSRSNLYRIGEKETAHDLPRQLKQRAALIWGVPEDDVE